MNQLTKVLLSSMLLNHIKHIRTLQHTNPQGFNHPVITQKLCYLNSDMKPTHHHHGGFKIVQNIPFQQYIKQSINKFPYCKLPKYNQRFSQQKQLSASEYEQMVAFNCLFVVNEANKQKQLRQMAEILLKDQFDTLVGNHERLSGAEVFSLYYQQKLPQMIQQMNGDSDIPQHKVTYYYQVLTNLLANDNVRKYVQKIKQQKILKMNAHIQSLHVKLLIKHNLSYIHMIDKLYQQHFATAKSSLQLSQSPSPRSQSPLANVYRLQAAKTLVTIQGYESLLSQNIKQHCLLTITENISNMQAFDHIMVIKHIYMSNSQQCYTYINKVTEEIMHLHKLGRSDELHVPLMLKVIKYRSKLHLDNKMFLDIINSYPDKFNTVFREKNVNKEIFLTLTTKQATAQLNPEIRSQFGSYICKVFEEYGSKSQIDEDELIRNLKLILKYGNEIKKQQLTQVMQTMVNSLYNRIKHAASEQLKYYIFLVAYTFNYEDLLVKTTIVYQTVETYHAKCLNQPTTDNITRMINVEYQLMRKSTQSELRKNIWAYNYTQVDLHPSVYSYLFVLFKKDKTLGINKEKINTINQLKKNIYKKLSHGNYSNKIIYTLIDVLDELKYNDKYMYVDIQRGIGKNLQKYLTSKDKKKGIQLPLPKDIMFLKNRLAKFSLCSTKFAQFLDQSQKNYHLIHQYAKDYIEKSKDWEKMKDNSKRNRKNLEKNTSTSSAKIL